MREQKLLIAGKHRDGKYKNGRGDCQLTPTF